MKIFKLLYTLLNIKNVIYKKSSTFSLRKILIRKKIRTRKLGLSNGISVQPTAKSGIKNINEKMLKKHFEKIYKLNISAEEILEK